MLPCRNPSQSRFSRQSQSGTLTEKKCEPCEPSAGSLNYMGLCMALSRQEAEEMLAKASLLRQRARQATDHCKIQAK